MPCPSGRRPSTLEHAPLVERVPIRVARGVDPAYAAIRQADEPAMVGAVAVSAAGASDPVTPGRCRKDGPRWRWPTKARRGRAPGRPASSTRRRRASGPRSIQTTHAPPSDAWRMSAARSPSAPRSRRRPPPTNLQERRRAYDDVARRIDEAHQRTDPRAVGAAKEAARQAFRRCATSAPQRARTWSWQRPSG